MDKEQFQKSFAHLSADEFAELVVGFNEDGQPIARDADAFRVFGVIIREFTPHPVEIKHSTRRPSAGWVAGDPASHLPIAL